MARSASLISQEALVILDDGLGLDQDRLQAGGRDHHATGYLPSRGRWGLRARNDRLLSESVGGGGPHRRG